FRNTFSSADVGAVQEIGPFSFSIPCWRPAEMVPLHGAQAFESCVQSWLNDVAYVRHVKNAPPEMQTVFESDVIPLLADGVIRAAGPRDPVLH
ncbi:MAG: hypothetical protein ABSD20_14240, partial [Terriglobales bacterium]